MMRRVEHLVTQIRRHTENVQVGTTDGITDFEIIQALNDAQESLTANIHLTNNKALALEKEYTSVSGQEEYDLPFDLFSQSHVVDFSWSTSSEYKDLSPLRKGYFKERVRDTGDPSLYILRRDKVLVNRIPDTSGNLGVMVYNPRLPGLDKRSGKVSAVTLNNTDNTITSLTLDNAFSVALADAGFDQTDYLTIVDRDGAVKMKAIPIDSVNTTSGAVTIASGFVFEAGETITTSHYACLGKYTTTNSQLPETCERFLLMYGYKRLFLRDSSNDYILQDKELKELMDEILNIFGQESNDVDWVPILPEF